MRRNRIYIWVSAIGILLLSLIAIQLIWLRDANLAHQRERKTRIAHALEQVEQKIRNTNYCFEMYGKTYINPDEAFYIVRQRQGSKSMDTVRLYYDTEGYYADTVLHSDRTMAIGYPTTAEIQLNFTLALPKDTDAFYQEQKAYYEKVTGKKLRDIISNKRPVESLFNMKKVDSFLAVHFKLEQLETAYQFGFIDAEENKVAFAERVSDSTALLNSDYQIALFSENKFLKPYKLAVLFPVDTNPLAGNFWLVLSILIIAILILSFFAFTRLYIKQTRLSERTSDFINNLTHEFNTPMANISLAIESLESTDQEQSPKLRRLLNIVSSESERLRENIERALQVAIMEKGNIQYKIEEVDLVATTQTLLTCYQLQCEQLGGNISFIHPAKAIVTGDETHLLNCICNLLDNAIKYRKGPPEIIILLEERDQEVLLSVSDNGTGMTSETQRNIFDKFYRAHQGDLHDTKGFGLGLSYVKGIVESHGGRITVASKKGSGAKFTIHLPKKPRHATH